MWYDLNICSLSWEETVQELKSKIQNKKVAVKTRVQAFGLLMAVDFIEENLLIELSKVWEKYATSCKEEFENLKVNKTDTPKYLYKSTDARDFFCRRLPVVIVYRASQYGPTACVIKKVSGVTWGKIIGDLKWPSHEQLFKQEVAGRLGNIIKQAMGFATSEKDRHILKYIFTKLTSTSFLVKNGIGGLKMNWGSLKRNTIQTESALSSWDKLRQNGTKNRYDEQKKKKEITYRQQGSGRPYIVEKFPELVPCLLSLFDGASGGLQAHPRLICETLYRNENSWLDMPRAVSILNQMFRIDISLSAAYTYTENFRSKSNQAKRHHEGKNINPKISLKRPTRDLNKHESINSHYAMADMQMSLNEMFDSGSIIARDDKALVHTDVEVVQRPSKSWIRINYSDHDWEKDCQRTLSITTYQFVEKSEMNSDSEMLANLGSIGISKTRVKGSGASLVKIHFIQPSTSFRHMNELLWIMSLDNHSHHFMKSDKFISKLLVTVDGGGDERPRNKVTKFCSVMIRWLLDLDKYKCQSLAEGQSKYHSVERLHTAENRALSYNGIISSRMEHESELSRGIFDQTKFEENMKHAQKEAVKRIDGVSYSHDKISSYVAPEDTDWVFSQDLEASIKKFLQTDSTNCRTENNFIIKPNGKLWDTLCLKFNLFKDKTTSAFHIYNAVTDPDASIHAHYSFTSYRIDDSWRGEPIPRYELQPIIDVERMPDFHYLSYKEVKALAEKLQETGEIPPWLKTPDFFMPSKNVKYLMESDPDILCSDLAPISSLIGVPEDRIVQYVQDVKEKEQNKLDQKKLLDSFKDNPLSLLTIAELKILLHTNFQKPAHSGRKSKADFLVSVDKEIKTRNLSDTSLHQLLGKLFPQKFRMSKS